EVGVLPGRYRLLVQLRPALRVEDPQTRPVGIPPALLGQAVRRVQQPKSSGATVRPGVQAKQSTHELDRTGHLPREQTQNRVVSHRNMRFCVCSRSAAGFDDLVRVLRVSGPDGLLVVLAYTGARNFVRKGPPLGQPPANDLVRQERSQIARADR